MTNFDPASLDWTVGALAGWVYDKPVNKWFQGQFRHAHRLTRPCPTCADVIVLDVTTKALEGKSTNHGLALRRCKKCRKALKAGPEAYAARKAEAAPAIERLEVATTVAVAPVDSAELESLRTANITMKDELDGLYATIRELHEQLAAYELAPAMERVAEQKPVVKAPVKPTAAFKPPERVVMMPQYIGENAVKPSQQNKSKFPW